VTIDFLLLFFDYSAVGTQASSSIHTLTSTRTKCRLLSTPEPLSSPQQTLLSLHGLSLLVCNQVQFL
ncbi:unnamed protein product, partial [Brassica rapa subsp. narinosa]